MATLVAIKGARAGDSFPLGDMAIIGRSTDADVRLDDLTVSRRHVRITHAGDNFVLHDLQSGNGTLVNGKPVSEVVLQDGDKVEVCDNVLVFYDDKDRGTSTVFTMVDDDESESEAIVNTVDVSAETLITRADTTATQEELLAINRRLHTMTEISQAIGFGLDEQQLFNQILNKLFEVYPQADRGFIILIDPKTRKFMPRATKTRGESDDSEIAISRTIISAVMENKKAVLSSNAMDDERFQGGQSIVNFQMRSVMCAPLFSQNDILGIIHIDTKRIANCFTEEDLTLLAGIANQAGMAVSNVRLHEQLIERSRMEQDLQYATRIQHSFLPQSPPAIETLEFADWYRAALEVGGDFYSYVDLPNGNLGICVGDVSGKGVSAALLMAKVSSDLRFLAAKHNEPAQILTQLNSTFFETNVDDVFVTLLFMSLNPKTRKLTVCNAGHLPPLLRHADGEVTKLEEPTGFPIGILDDPELEQMDFQLAAGELFCVFSDGIVEAMSPQRQPYGYEPLIDLLKQPAESVEEAIASIRQDVARHTSGTSQSDDLTLILFKTKDV